MLFNVYDKESARTAYNAVKMFEELKDVNIKDYIDDLKREIRKWTNRKCFVDSFFDGDVDRRVVKDYGIDGFIEFVTLPEGIDNEKYADEFFHRYVYIEPVNSLYDCTGKIFTSWYKLFKRKGRFYAYHSVSVDV